ncbi:MAG: bifunctional hydroxymethylpyrimidine kinase/phosphomethylpyrimidine kinase [Bacteroidales bacterium]|nr:bifunctional hydroxymethylpyrimidine kinase/phosphomethylpyrimidine kinase [Bacteroidales bacterium]
MESHNNKKLLVYDLAGYGKVALSVMIPIFSRLKFETFNLPTALVSNTFDYGKFDILDTTAYMRNTIGIWDQLGFSFDAICTGFIASKEQSQLVTDYCRRHKERNGAKVFVDPVMADNGFLYNGVTFETVLYLRELCSTADVVLPNITEACFLTGVKVNGEERVLIGASAAAATTSTSSAASTTSATLTRHRLSFSAEEIDSIVAGLKGLGAKNVVITSANLEGRSCTIVGKEGQEGWVPFYYKEIPAQFAGTGDTFTSLVASSVMRGNPLEEAVPKAMKVMEYLISTNFQNEDKYKGIPIEQYLDSIKI